MCELCPMNGSNRALGTGPGTRATAWPAADHGDVGGRSQARPLSSKVNDFNQFLITDHTGPGRGDTQSGATSSISTRELPGYYGCHFDGRRIKKGSVLRGPDVLLLLLLMVCRPLMLGDLAGGRHRHRPGPGRWSDCFITRVLLELRSLYNT